MAKRNQPAAGAPAPAENEWDEGKAGAVQPESAQAADGAAGEPKQPSAPVEAETAPAEKPLPNDVRECFALLKELEKLPEHKRHLAEAKAAKMAPIKAHIARLQQGPVAPHIDAHAYGHAVGGQRDLLKRSRWEHLARLHPEVKALLAERDALAKKLETIEKASKTK